MIGDALALARKDLRIELRQREMVLGMAQFAATTLVITYFLTSAIGSIGTSIVGSDVPPALDQAQLRAAGGAIWIVVIFTAVLGLNRSFAADTEEGAFDMLALAPIDRGAIWLGKVFSQLVFLLLVEAVLLPLAWLVFLGAASPRAVGTIALSVVIADLGLVAVGVLAAALTLGARAGDVLLPVIFLPLTLPLVAVGVAVSFGALSDSGRVLDGLAFLALYDAVFALLAWGTYEHVIGD